MSDIAIRLDGLVLVGVLALGAGLYLLGALVLGAAALARRGGRLGAIARRAWRIGAVAALVFVVALLAWERSGTAHSGADWLDWLAIPAAAAFALGWWWVLKAPAVNGESSGD